MHNYVEADNATNLSLQTLQLLKSVGRDVVVRGHATREVAPFQYVINNPRKRITALSGRTFNIFFNYAEDLWIIQGRGDADMMLYYNKQLAEYVDDFSKNVFHAPYGYRLRHAGQSSTLGLENFGVKVDYYNGGKIAGEMDQLEHCYKKLLQDSSTRQAVMTIWNPLLDNLPSKDIPCNNWTQFLLRDGMLNMHQVVRSNDILWGTSTNIMQFTTLQEIMAGWLGVQVGKFTCFVGSMHYYKQLEQQVEDIFTADRKYMSDYVDLKDEFQYMNPGLDVRDAEAPARLRMADSWGRPDVYRKWKEQDCGLEPKTFASMINELSAFESMLRQEVTRNEFDESSYDNWIKAIEDIGVHGPYWEDYARVFYIYALLKSGMLEFALDQAACLKGACRYSVTDYILRYRLREDVEGHADLKKVARSIVGQELFEYMNIKNMTTVMDLDG